MAPGFKYNLTDIAAAIGIHQLARAEQMRQEREARGAGATARHSTEIEELELPPDPRTASTRGTCIPIRLRLDRLTIDRNAFMEELKEAGVGCSVHWRPLHLHPYYKTTFGWRPEDFPVATSLWQRLVSLPIFPGMRQEEVLHVIETVRDLCARHLRPVAAVSVPFEGMKAGGDSSRVAPGGIPRPFEFVAAALGLVLMTPVVALAGLMVKASSRGPILFRQERVGRGGRSFVLYKLRTMLHSADGPQVTARGDARITPVGRMLRRTKLDELPQLWNVVRGDMALVGPRPEVPRYVRTDDPLWKEVLRVRPGITDPVTLQLRDEESILASAEGDPERFYREELLPAKLREYVAYSRRRNWRTDVGVLCGTVLTVLWPTRPGGAGIGFAKTRSRD